MMARRWFACLAVLGVSLQALTLSNRRSSDQQQLFVFVHHKTGTHLIESVVESLTRMKGFDGWHISDSDNSDEEVTKCSFPTQIVVFKNFMPDQLAKLNKNCPNYLAVHLVRDPKSIVESGYAYHIWSDDTWRMRDETGPDILAKLSLKDGVAQEAKAETHEYGSIYQEMKTMATLKGDSRVVTFALEDIARDFDASMRKLFKHLLPGHENQVEEFVKMIAEAAPSRQDGSKDPHISDEKKEEEVHNMLEELISEGNAYALKVEDYERQYDEAMPSSGDDLLLSPPVARELVDQLA